MLQWTPRVMAQAHACIRGTDSPTQGELAQMVGLNLTTVSVLINKFAARVSSAAKGTYC
jgi:hypothetical protein